MTIRLNDAHAIPLIAQRAGIDINAKVYCIAHYDHNDKLTSGVLIMQDNGWSAEIHSATFTLNHWVGREILWTVFNYIFKVRKLKKLFGRVPENNKRAIRFNTHLGFKQEYIIDDVFPGGEGLVVMAMYEEDCRYVNCPPPRVVFANIDQADIIEVREFNYGR